MPNVTSSRTAPSEGTLESISVPQLLAEIWRDQRTGRLRLSRGQREWSLQIEDGAPTALETAPAEDRLAQLLEDSGQLRTAERLQVEQLAQARGCSQASAIHALGLLDATRLYQTLREATRTQICETFEWSQGAFAWSETPAGSKSLGKPFDILGMIQDQLARRWGTERLFQALLPEADRVGDISPRVRRVADRLGSAGPVARRIIQRIDGQISIGRLLGECAGDPLAASTLWVLLHAGLLRLRDPALETTRHAALELEVVVDMEAATSTGAHARGGRSTQASSARANATRSSKGEALRAEIRTLRGQLEHLSHYEALGLELDANPIEIKKAYFQAAKKYHPDALTRIGLEDLEEDAAQVFARISAAFETLSDKDKKARYDSGESAPAQIDTARLTQAETSFRKGEILLRMGNFRGALEYLERAVELWPEEPAYQAALGWALHKQPQSDPERACEHLSIAHGQDPTDALTLFRLGLARRALGESTAADECIARARALRPDIVA